MLLCVEAGSEGGSGSCEASWAAGGAPRPECRCLAHGSNGGDARKWATWRDIWGRTKGTCGWIWDGVPVKGGESDPQICSLGNWDSEESALGRSFCPLLKVTQGCRWQIWGSDPGRPDNRGPILSTAQAKMLRSEVCWSQGSLESI